MSNIHPIFEDILNAFTGLPASVSGHVVAAAAAEAPSHGSADRDMVAAENISAQGAFDALPMRNPEYDGPMGIFTDYEGCESGIVTKPNEPTADELARVEQYIRTEGRKRVREKLDEIDRKNVGTPRTRLPWEEGK